MNDFQDRKDLCAACGGDRLVTLFDLDRGCLARCPACGLAQTVDGLDPGQLGKLYDQVYQDELPPDPDERELDRLRRPLATALELSPPPGRLLEVGVGRGWLLKEAREAGYEVLGADLNPAAAAEAGELAGAEVLVGPVEELAIRPGSLDIILLRHVLEHSADPVRFLTSLAGLLKPGGLVTGSVPNFGSFKARLDGPDWSFLMTPFHRLHFDRKSLRGVMVRAGLEPVKIRTDELVLYDRALFQVGLNRLRRFLGRPVAPTGYDPGEVEVNSPLTWLLAREDGCHRLLARLGLGEDLVFAVRRPDSD